MYNICGKQIPHLWTKWQFLKHKSIKAPRVGLLRETIRETIKDIVYKLIFIVMCSDIAKCIEIAFVLHWITSWQQKFITGNGHLCCVIKKTMKYVVYPLTNSSQNDEHPLPEIIRGIMFIILNAIKALLNSCYWMRLITTRIIKVDWYPIKVFLNVCA